MLYKTQPRKQDRRSRATNLAQDRKLRRDIDGLARRGIPDSLDDSDDEKILEEPVKKTTILTPKPRLLTRKQKEEEGLQKRLRQLEEFRKQKKNKKVEEAKKKKPPFKAGAVHHAFNEFNAGEIE
jgi:hypothetical protein